jgi:hypothetical protein
MNRARGAPAVEAAPPVTAAADEAALAEDLRHLRDLLEEGHVEEARHFVNELAIRWPDAERVRHYAHVLAPPVARVRSDIKPRSFTREWEWLKENGHEYPGCWLAIYEDRLVAADPDRQVVVAKAREELGQEGALLYHQPPASTPR